MGAGVPQESRCSQGCGLQGWLVYRKGDKKEGWCTSPPGPQSQGPDRPGPGWLTQGPGLSAPSPGTWSVPRAPVLGSVGLGTCREASVAPPTTMQGVAEGVAAGAWGLRRDEDSSMAGRVMCKTL